MLRPFCPKTRPSGQRCVLMSFGAYPLIGMRGCNETLRLISVHFSILDWIRRRDSLQMREENVVDMLESCFDVIHDLVCLLDHFCLWDSQFHVFFTKAWPKASRTDRRTDTLLYRCKDASKKQNCVCIVIKSIVNDKWMKATALENAANGCLLSPNVFIQGSFKFAYAGEIYVCCLFVVCPAW